LNDGIFQSYCYHYYTISIRSSRFNCGL